MLDCLPVEIDVKCCFSVQFTDGTIRYYSVRKALNISVMKNRKILGLLCCAFVEVIFVSCAQNRDHGHPEAEYGLKYLRKTIPLNSANCILPMTLSV